MVQPGDPTDNFAPQKFYELDMKETAAQAASRLCADHGSWAFDGHVPGPLIQAKYGEPIMVRYHNHLPSVKIPQAFGIAEMTTHLHNGHTPSESDGNPVNYFNSINDLPIDPVTGSLSTRTASRTSTIRTCSPASPIRDISVRRGNPTEALGSLWYHDHHLDFTAQNVYKGMFGCYNLFDDMDTR